jgi:hypothetical protein
MVVKNRFFVCLMLVCSVFVSARAQFGVRVDIKTAARSSGSSGGSYNRGPVVIQKVTNRVITKTEMVRASSLSVVTTAGAKVEIKPLAKTTKAPPPVVADRNGSAIFEDVKPGEYRVSASKDGFVTQEQDLVKIAPQRTHVLDLSLPPITYKLRIRTPNVTDGEVRFAQAEYKGKDANGSIIAEEFGNKCFVKIQKVGNGGVAEISDLRKGYYNLDIRPAALQYEPTLVGLNVPDDTEQDPSGEAKTFEIEPVTKISTEVFGASWTKDSWIVPAGWSLSNRLKVGNSPGVALPRDERYRYYTNFELISDVKLSDGGTAGFALRAADPLNYYLVQISGQNAPEPNFVKGFIVQNGEAKQFFSVSAPFAATTSSKNGFRVLIKGDAKGFAMWIENSETGVRKPVTIISDPYNTFQKGAVGIASREKSNFEVMSFQVCPNECR